MRNHIDYPEIPFHLLLHRTAERLPQKVAIVFQERRLTFSEWDARASQTAHGLIELGVRAGDRIGLYLPNCPEYEIAFFGCARMGAVPTPLNPSYKAREAQYQLHDCGASGLIVHASLLSTIEAIRPALTALRCIVVVGGKAPAYATTFSDLLAGQPNTVPKVTLGPEDLVALPYSSGTTGTAKGVMLTQRNLVHNTLQFVEATQSTERDILMVFLPLYHIYGVALASISAACGATQVLLERFDLAEVIRLIAAEQVTEFYVAPPVMLLLAKTPELTPDQFHSVRFTMSAAAPLSVELARQVATRLGLHIIQAYGMTESSPLTHMVPLNLSGVHESVGVVAADTECRIVDLKDGERELPVGEVGEVTVRGAQVMSGYWNAPQETALALRNGRLHTGDVGRVDEHGNLYVVDRKKEMIKYKAFSIAPAELEGVLLGHAAVLDCAVTSQPDDEAGEVPRAYVVVRPGADVAPEELQHFVAERVAGYKQIRFVEFVDSIPRTASGKLLRRVLKEQASKIRA
jgi:acyl-CoA synthetase (AMP-forming)/AMP-acid ligase II